MSDRHQTPPTPLGIYDKPRKERITAIEIVALLVSLIWLGLSAVFFFGLDPNSGLGGTEDALQFVMVLMAVFFPVAMIWVAATAARTSKVMREESQRLQVAIDAIRHAYVTQSQNRKRRGSTRVPWRHHDVN